MTKLTIADWFRKIFGMKAAHKPRQEKSLKRIKRTVSRVRPAKKMRRKKLRRKMPTKKMARKQKPVKKTQPKKIIPRMRKRPETKPAAKPGFFSGLFKRRGKPKEVAKPKPEKGRPAIQFFKKKPEITRPIPKKLPKEIIREFVASDIMTKKVVTLRTNDPLSYVVRLFGDRHISGAPVLNRNGNLVGVLGEVDIVQYVGSEDLLDAQTNRLDKLKETKVEGVMRKAPKTVFEHTPIHEVNDIMNKQELQRVIVVGDRRQVDGIITRGDMVRGISKEMLLKMVHKPREFEKSEIDTDVDDVLETVEKKGTISIDEIRKRLNMPEDKIEEWGRILEKHNLIEIFYPPIGRPSFRKKVI